MNTSIYGPRGLFLRYYPCFLSILPNLIARGPYTWPFLVLWTIFGIVRCHYNDSEIVQDCFIYSAINLFILRKNLWESLHKAWKELDSRNNGADRIFSALTLGCIIAFAPIGAALIYRGFGKRLRERVKGHEDSFPTNFKEYKAPDHPKPLIFPCRTTHARVFPKRHAFGYSYLLYGFPIIPKMTAADGTHHGYWKDSRKGKWWLQVRAEDYLDRGFGNLGFYEKLKMTLRCQGVSDSEWSYAYLVTAPRFFGYSFNPVSFWYIYDEQNELKKMLLEVNNTFGERRLYVLHGSNPVETAQSSSSETSMVDVLDSPPKRFVDNWPKDFHVSPFNSRKGHYSLKALNPFPSPDHTPVLIDNTITLLSSKDHAKIVARVNSTGKPLDPANLGIFGTMRFVGGWFWVGFVTSPRILREAFKLYFKRSLHVWLRPEPRPSSIGRMPTSIETDIQKVFLDYLYDLVHSSSEQFNITYQTAIPGQPTMMLGSTHIQGRKINPKIFEIRVLSPAFYSRFVYYVHASEAFDRESLFTDERNRTLEVSHPDMLHLLLSSARPHAEDSFKRSYLSETRWALLRHLRCPPPDPAYPETSSPSSVSVSDIRAVSYSDMDAYSRQRNRRFEAGHYRRTVTKIFLARRYALGFVEVVDLLDVLLRIALGYAGSRMLFSPAHAVEQHGVDRTLGLTPGTWLGESMGANVAWWWLSKKTLGVCASHLYGLLKGYI